MKVTMNDNKNNNKERVCIIGAGAAGLAALKNVLEYGWEAAAYEQCNAIGGTWIYNENVSLEDEVHSSMYEGLRTNLPKEAMGYPGFEYSALINESFIYANEVLDFLKSYADHYKLMPHIKLEHEILRVRPWKGAWQVHIKDLKSNEYFMKYFDFVFVCNGHYTTPRYPPQLKGMDIYKGTILHSHHYRKADKFKDGTLLIVGAGPSGMDIAQHIFPVAKHIYLSHRSNPAPRTDFMPNLSHKSSVESFTETGAIFSDGSSAEFSYVLFCTGYKSTFPFLSMDCGLNIDENYVYPLYKHCLNINNPTMALIGVPNVICPTHLFDLQVRFALHYYTKQRELPSRAEMLDDEEREMSARFASGLTKVKAHEMGKRQFAYYDDLAETAGITKIKPVILKMMASYSRKFFNELDTFRNAYFRVIDDVNFSYTKYNVE